MYMLDTNICIHVIKNRSAGLLDKIRAVINNDGVAISAITLSELKYGVYNSDYPGKNHIALIQFLSIVSILPYGDKAADEYGALRADLRRRGELIGANDMLIAAHAKSLNMTLVTNNTKEFSRVADLSIEDWTH
ncbi:MAG: type II toxin-antitoxin system VapC family toxin [Acidobacteriota bacterium]|nr:type II toxin-antitoxin system VapC family toxin [Acidobacteriota bacterium]